MVVARMEMPVTNAPTTPLNLQFGVLYTPRVPTPPFLAFDAVERAPGDFVVRSYGDDGYVSIAPCRTLAEAWVRLAQCLRMDVAP